MKFVRAALDGLSRFSRRVAARRGEKSEREGVNQ